MSKPCENCGYVAPKGTVHTYDGCIARLKEELADWKGNAMFRKGVVVGLSVQLHFTLEHNSAFSACNEAGCRDRRLLIDNMREPKDPLDKKEGKER